MSVSAPAFPWKKAAFLHERAAAGGCPPAPAEGASLQAAERRAKAWRQLMSGDEPLLEERLRSIGLDRASFLHILTRAGHDEGEVEGDSAWVALIQEVLGSRYAGEPLPPSLRAPEGPDQPGLVFSGFLQPFLRLGAARLRAGVAGLQARGGWRQSPLSPEAETELLESLAFRLHGIASRVLILELNVARLMEQLPGDTPQARFHHFSTVSLREPGAVQEVLDRYPVLARLLAITLERWSSVSLELVEHLTADRFMLGEVFLDGRDVGPLVQVKTGISDLHRQGHGVALVRFGSGLRLVYKPKPLGVDVRFQQLLQELNARGLRHPHRILQVLDRGTHGWVEHVDAAGCDSREALQRFYWRQGSSLALLQVLAAVDFHLENLIAAGEYPVLVDLEALFHQRAPIPVGDSAYERTAMLLGRSVLSVGLLPQLVMGGPGGGGGVDMSGLGGEPGQVSSQALPAVEDAFHDTMRIVRRQSPLEGSHNRPRLQGQPVEATGFTEDIVQGFEETYRLLMREREALEPRIRSFANVEVRHIARATQRYGLLLEESHHPDFLRDGLERDKVLDNLWSETRIWPALRRLVPHEHADLRLGDVPMFTSRPGERHLWSSTGECIPDYFERDSLGGVLERLARLEERDCAHQVSLIRKSMLALDKGRTAAGPVAGVQREAPRAPATPEQCLAAAVALGEDLAAKAIHGRTDVCWPGVSLEDLKQWRWTLAPLGPELYEGVGGLAVFFAHLAARTGRGDFEALARAALEPVRRAWKLPGPNDTRVGAFLGRSSALYVLGHLGLLWNEPALLDEALAGLSTLEPLIDGDTRLDVLSGSAGCALALLGLHERTGEARFLEAARRCGERLLATAMPCPGGGVGWRTPAAEQPLAGFSHGATGFALALLTLASVTGDARYGERAHEALAYERSLFVPERGNWKDLRGAPGEEARFVTAWCHGAPGIALGRLRALRYLDGPHVRAELETALGTTLREGFGGNHCLCHGDLGNVEALLVAGEVLQEPRWSRLALEQAAGILQGAREGGWRCGLPRNTETPGLMMGLAGIGYGLLRLAAPEQVPSVLTLALPGWRTP
ncbi:type 2 lanthipeptide synthetase LanM family protein [Archangium gephyra]|uniref:type 2 lanthipeptide synthetase LanM family protein n=1 Tax=Archangium gephyra TaxID=48 RepID=UPI0035D3FCDE